MKWILAILAVGLISTSAMADRSVLEIQDWYDLDRFYTEPGDWWTTNCHWQLMNDITQPGSGVRLSLGDSLGSVSNITFDGQGYSILGINMHGVDAGIQPSIFGEVHDFAISNIYIKGATIDASGSPYDAAGVIAAESKGTFTAYRVALIGCTVSGAATSGGFIGVGGFVGHAQNGGISSNNSISLEECAVVSCAFASDDGGLWDGNCGALVGAAAAASLKNVQVSDAEISSPGWAGGLFGSVEDITVTGPYYFHGSVVGNVAGGITAALATGASYTADGVGFMVAASITGGSSAQAGAFHVEGDADVMLDVNASGNGVWVETGGNADYLSPSETGFEACTYTTDITDAYSELWAGYTECGVEDGFDFSTIWTFAPSGPNQLTLLPQLQWMVGAQDLETVDFK